jgi:hypothetical protein
MRRYRISVVVGLALMYALALSPHQTASAEVCPGSDQVIKHPDHSNGSTEVSFRVLPAPGTDPSRDRDEECDEAGADSGWDGENYGSGGDSGWNGDHYGSGSLPFTGPRHNVIFALESGVAAILLGTLLVLLSRRADRSRRISRIAGR